MKKIMVCVFCLSLFYGCDFDVKKIKDLKIMEKFDFLKSLKGKKDKIDETKKNIDKAKKKLIKK